ncbi:MAG: permease [Thermoguttaceae bacterium]|nr:permease [Thermoguttaceae bacterium]
MARYRWARWGDLNAFFGLMLDNLTVMILLAALITSPQPEQDKKFSRDFVLTQMIPGTALGVLVGDLIYTWMAFRLARRSGRDDVTAMPLGLDTPSTFAVGPLVLLPALQTGLSQRHLSHQEAMVFSWHVGAVLLVWVGLFKTIVAPLGAAVRRWVPRAGLLGSLAAIALVLIAFLPLWQHIAAIPVVGMASLVVILVALVAHRRLPGGVPGALAAAGLGVGIYWLSQWLGPWCGWPIAPPAETPPPAAWQLPELLPAFAQNWAWWEAVFQEALKYLPIMLPFALATIVGGIDCTESAAAAGDHYNTRTILLTEGVASVLAGLAGGVIQNTPYIGHPAYKAMGGRAAYTLGTAVFIGLAGLFGWFAWIFLWLPEAALFTILVFIGLEITAQSYQATPNRHMPALALAVLPALAYLVLVGLKGLAGPPAGAAVSPAGLALRTLANGFIITSLLWASVLAAILDGRMFQAAIYMLVAAGCSLFGIIHSPLDPAVIALPQQVVGQMPPEPALRCQSPYHWTAAYLIGAGLLILLALCRPQTSPSDKHDFLS